MATGCRKSNAKRVNRYRLVRFCSNIILLLLVVGGFMVGRWTAHPKTDTATITEPVEVPVYADGLPEVEDVFYYDVPLSHSLQRFIYEVCADENVPVALAMAMIDHESHFNPEAVSETDDYGLMQINAINHEQLEEQYRAADMLDPYQNVFCGIKIIGSYIEKYEDYSYALMAYNMGDYGARKAWENGVTNTDYSTTILNLMQKYEEVLHNAEHDGA